VRTDDSIEGGTYSVKLRTTRPGLVDIKAAAPGAGESNAVSIRVKG
jgi:hypothetical protein